jgi:hypothetical protein
VVIGANIANDGATVLDGFTVTGGNANVTIGIVNVNGVNIYRYQGGGIFNNASSPALTNVTVSGNSATNGGGIFNESSSSSTLNNTLVWGNNSGVSGSGYTYNYSLVQGVAAAGTNLGGSINPQFVSPVAAGLSTGGDYRLQSTSPAIDAGNKDYNASPVDLAGNIRVWNSEIDMGAYEYGSPKAISVTFRFGNG